MEKEYVNNLEYFIDNVNGMGEMLFSSNVKEEERFFPFRFRDECRSPKPQGRGV